MKKCKLKKGDRIYECRYNEATLTELITDPELLVQGSDSHYWHWKAKVIETNSHDVVPGEIVAFGITEEAPGYGPYLYRQNVYEVGYDITERLLPPFDTNADKRITGTDDGINLIRGLSFNCDERGITCKGHSVLEKLSIHPIGEGMLWIGESHGPLYYANSYKGIARQLLDENSNLIGFEDKDFDWDKLKDVEHPYDLNHRHVDYGGLGRYNDFRDGVCCLCWMLYPDGRYFADEDGFGMEDNDEENIYCVIDSNLRIVIPWQPMTDEEMAAKMREAREMSGAPKSDTVDKGKVCSIDLEEKAMQFVSKIASILKDRSQESIDSLFSVLDCLSLKPGYRLGLKIASREGIGDESWFYTYPGDEASEEIDHRIMQRRMIFDDIIVEQSAMGAWQTYLLYIAPTIMPTWWHGGYINREFFFDREHYRGVTSNWGRKDVDIELSQIPQPTVEMKDGKAIVSCPYWNDWKGLVLQTVNVEFKSDGTIDLNSHSKVLYKYDCGVCF